MGEYATYNGIQVKIGTCENMYYIRYEDRFKVVKDENSLDPAREENLFWRLPFPDEDFVSIGNYEEYNRGIRLQKDDKYFEDESLIDDPGSMQLHHESGLLVSVPCYHGLQLPANDVENGIRFGWNGKTPTFLKLCSVKNDSVRGIVPVVRCIYCGKMWSYDMHDILEYVNPYELRQRLEKYIL